ncbi:efflux RND transporter permease subunit [Halovivax limisalsi]|uniref:efflux RND transporter permease subunit n=1 Tax=Halovivax limisalsi TaxID=1453760 RepID=UPI001FFC58F0|nr:MMPL family transporter [Halovivax limisalsi]
MTGSRSARYAAWIVENRLLVLVTVLLCTAAIGAGAVFGAEPAGDADEFAVETESTAALDRIDATYRSENAIVTQLVVRSDDGDVLTRDSLLESLRLQRELSERPTVNETLTDRRFQGIENVVATAAAMEDRSGGGGSGEVDAAGRTPTLDQQIRALERRSPAAVESLLADVLASDAPTGNDSGSTGNDPVSSGNASDSAGNAIGDPYAFLPTSYEPGSTRSESRITFAFHTDATGADGEALAHDAQFEIESAFEERFAGGFVFGAGIVDAASANAVGDSFAIITPVALALVLAILAVAYRDLVDVVLSLVGIVIVLCWFAGIQGWLAIPGGSMLVAIPFLLVGLSIDYSLHVVMRYREARSGSLERTTDERTDDGRESPANGMRIGLTGVVLALVAATISTGVGFLANALSPLPAIEHFAILSAAGIVATFVAFGVFLPALKVTVDDLLERRFGRSRRQPPLGTDGSAGDRALSAVSVLARRAPVAVVVLAVLVAAFGATAATDLDTEFDRTDFLPEDPPEWTASLPDPLEPDTYTVREEVAYLSSNFQDRRSGSQVQFLIRGNVTDPALFDGIESAATAVGGDTGVSGGAGIDGGSSASDSLRSAETIDVRADGSVAMEGPSTFVASVASENETVAAALHERDTEGDGLPDADVAGLYALVFEAAPERASSVLHRTADGSYESARLTLSVRSDASVQAVTADAEAFAAAIERAAAESSETGVPVTRESGDSSAASRDRATGSAASPISVVATGGPVVTAAVQDALLETFVRAFAVTVVVVLVLLTVLYWVRHRSLALGVLTLVPVVAALASLLGAMALLSVPFNTETVVMTSLAIGLGVDYSIHVGERFVWEVAARRDAAVRGSEERARRRNETDRRPGVDRSAGQSSDDVVEESVRATVQGTGGALLGSAATTAAGFGVLALALSPPLQRFGLVTGLSIVLAFVASLTVLPSLLVLRERVLDRWYR